MQSIIEWLNNNQGVIGALSLIVSTSGFFIVTNRIQKISTQSQKSWKDSVNQQSQSGGISQNAGKNIHN